MHTNTGFIYYWFLGPFKWVVLAIFQPARFEREFQPQGSWLEQKIVPLLRLFLPLFLITYPLILLIKIFLLSLNILSYGSLSTFFLLPACGIACGIILGSMLGIVFGGAFVSLGGSMLAGVLIGELSIMYNSTIHIVFAAVTYIVLSALLGIVLGGAVGIALSIMEERVFNIVLGGIVGVMLSIAFGIVSGTVFGIVSGTVFGISYFAGLYRLPLYLISGGSVLMSYMHSCSNPSQTLLFLQYSALHWDERVYLPLPYLKRMLLMAYHEQPVQTLQEISYIAAERSLQLRAAQAAVLEIAMRDLEQRKNMQEIAEAALRVEDILPQEAKLMNPRWARSFALLTDASQDALQSMTPIGLNSRTRAIEQMMNSLHKISPNVAFRDQNLNQRLKQVIEVWMTTAERERERLRSAAQEVGHIDNPYKPGQVLQPQDSLFVGRRDLAEQLESELAKGSRRPTLLLNGERRMGKTSALLQLPYLLGSPYIPIFYNLQDPGIYGSTAAFLGTIAQSIHTQFQARGLPLKAFGFRELQEHTYRSNDVFSYSLFNNWLKNVESMLEKEERTLVLAFDEFEKLEEAGQNDYLNLSLLLDWFRSIVQFHPRIALLFSGVRTLDEMGRGTGVNWSSYLINVQSLKVTFLREEEARKLISEPVPDYPSEEIFGEGVVEGIMQVTGCHPFLIQAICSALIDNLNVEKRERAELADVEAAMEQTLESWVGYFSDLWMRTDANQRACLIALNTLQSATIDAVQQESGLDNAVVRRTLQVLRKRDLIMGNSAGEYFIAVPIFSKWVESSRYL